MALTFLRRWPDRYQYMSLKLSDEFLCGVLKQKAMLLNFFMGPIERRAI